jgi:CheY-like chemotaxis protein
LKVESVLGEGSRFYFSLPLVLLSETEAARHRDDEVAAPLFDAKLAPGEELTALVVDDSTANRRILASLLESAGVRVITAAGGFEAIRLTRAHRPEVVFMDLRMSDLDGVEATRRLRADPTTARIPIIAVTAYGKSYYRQAIEAGCDDLINKPLDFDNLEPIFNQYLAP